METNRDRRPLSDAERARRYRARLRGEDVPMGRPGRKPEPIDHVWRAIHAAGALRYELGWITPEKVIQHEEGQLLDFFLDQIAPQIDRLRQRHDSPTDRDNH